MKKPCSQHIACRRRSLGSLLIVQKLAKVQQMTEFDKNVYEEQFYVSFHFSGK